MRPRPPAAALALAATLLALSAPCALPQDIRLWPAGEEAVLHAPRTGTVAGDGMYVLVSSEPTPSLDALVPCAAFSSPTWDSEEVRCLRPSSSDRTENDFFLEYLPHDWGGATELRLTVEVFLVHVEGGQRALMEAPIKRLLKKMDHSNNTPLLRSFLQGARAEGWLVGGGAQHVRLVAPSTCAPDPTSSPPRLFYAFMFSREFQLLDLVQRELGPEVVDAFLVIEANMSHSGAPKPLHLVESGESPFA